MNKEQKNAKEWFLNLRNDLVNTLEIIEGKKFNFKDWSHSGSGGGTMGSIKGCLLYTSPSPRDYAASRMPSSA